MDEILIGVMDLQEAKNHESKLKALGVPLHLKMNSETCTTGCKVTVEVWGRGEDQDSLQEYFQKDYLKHVKGHEPKAEHLSAVFDPSAETVVCQACGAGFSPTVNECPDCGLVY